MSDIAERIKQKLEAFEQYNFEEREEKEVSESEVEEQIIQSEEEQIIEFENLKKDCVGFKESKDQYINEFLIEKNIELSEISQSCRNFEVEKNDNYILLEKDINYKINEFVTNKLNRQSDLKQKNSSKQSLKNKKNSHLNLNLNNIKISSNSSNNNNYQTNYSTDHSQNIDSNRKKGNFNYIELGNSREESFDEYVGYFKNTSSENNSSILTSLEQEEKSELSKKASGAASDSSTNMKLYIHKNTNYDEDYIFTLRKISSFGNKDKDSDSEKKDKNHFDEIEMKEKESFYYKKFEESNNHINYADIKSNNSKKAAADEENNYNSSKTENNNNNNSLCRKFLIPTFYFLEEFILVALMVILLFLDPIIILILKIVDYILSKFSNCFNNNKQYSKINEQNENNSNNNNHLLFCGEIEEIDFYNLENYDNPIPKATLTEKYFNYFFNNYVYKNQRNIIKICFIATALVMNIFILTTVEEKVSKILLFFLNNLYLLYHTMDIYNEKLLSHNENLGWFKIMNSI